MQALPNTVCMAVRWYRTLGWYANWLFASAALNRLFLGLITHATFVWFDSFDFFSHAVFLVWIFGTVVRHAEMRFFMFELGYMMCG